MKDAGKRTSSSVWNTFYRVTTWREKLLWALKLWPKVSLDCTSSLNTHTSENFLEARGWICFDFILLRIHKIENPQNGLQKDRQPLENIDGKWHHTRSSIHVSHCWSKSSRSGEKKLLKLSLFQWFLILFFFRLSFFTKCYQSHRSNLDLLFFGVTKKNWDFLRKFWFLVKYLKNL